MKKILFAAILLVSLMICLTSPGWASALDDVKAGLAAANEGDNNKAIGLFTKAIESGELSREDLSKAYIYRGNIWVGPPWAEKRDFDKAIADYTKAIEIDPKDDTYYSRGLLWGDKGNYDKAIADFTKVIEINPKNELAYSARGTAWYRKRDFDKAIADYTKAIEIHPKFAVFYVSRGFASDGKGDFDKAIADYTKAIKIEPQLATAAYYNRGHDWYHKGDYDKAIADYTKTIELYAEPEHNSAYTSLAWLMATCPEGRYRDGKRAVELAEKTLIVEETSGRLDILAAAYAEAGRFQEAIGTQERALAKFKEEHIKPQAHTETNYATNFLDVATSLPEFTKSLPEFEQHLSSYKAGKPWREK